MAHENGSPNGNSVSPNGASVIGSNGGPVNGNGFASAGAPSDGGAQRLNGAAAGAIPVDWERLARATAHPLRVSILEILGLDGGRALSPIDLSRELQIPLSNTNYHVRELAKAGLIELAGQRPVRGATEHFYRLPGVTVEHPEAVEPPSLPARAGTAI